jgi:hypothetical protein
MADLGVMIRFKSHPKDATIENKDSLLKGSKKLKSNQKPKGIPIILPFRILLI